jgi:hypothetical protein
LTVKVEISFHNKYRKDGCGLHSFTDDADKVNKITSHHIRSNTCTRSARPITATGSSPSLINLTSRLPGLLLLLSQPIGML